MATLWTDLNPAEITAFSRTVAEAEDTGVFASILPSFTHDEIVFSWRVNSILADVATYGEYDTESTVGREGGGEEKIARLLPVSRKLRLSEMEQVSDPDRVRELAEGKALPVVRAVLNRINKARAEALVSGKIALNENGVKVTADFQRNAGQTNVAPDDLWSETTADPIAFLRDLVDQVSDESGVTPDVQVHSTRTYTALAARLAGSGYVGSGTQAISRATVDDVLASYDLPRIVVDNTRVAGQRLVADNVVLLAPTGGVAGGTPFGPTVESRDPRFNLAAGQQSGLVAGVYSEDDPPVKWVMGKASALPILANPNTTASAVVL